MDGGMKFYNNNPNIKGVGQALQFTGEQVQEYLKCSEDVVYFINNYCKIVTLDFGLQPFKLHSYQERLVKSINDNRKVIALLGRQFGKTATSAAYILWYTLFNANKNVAIMAHKAPAAREVLYRYQLMYEHLPKWLQQGIRVWNKGNIELENGSIVFTSATSASGIRGKSVNLLYLDETSSIPNTIADQFFASVYPTISAGNTTKIIMSSTPLGYNHFWKFWNDAKHDKNGFVTFHAPWTEVPGRDAAWAEDQRRLLGEVKFNQEVLCAFQGSSFTLVNAVAISKLTPETPIFQNENLDIYEKPIKDHLYFISVDTSKGVGEDYSTFAIIDISEVPYKVVGKYRDNLISPMLYPSIIYKVAKDYNDAYVLIEINSSEQVAYILYGEYEYDNMVFITRTKHGQQLSGGFGGGGSTQYGVITDKKVKRIGCNAFKVLVEENKLLIPDADIISEISTFIQVKDSFAADDGYHDDLVIPLILFSWATTNGYFRELSDIDLRRSMYADRMKAIEDELTPFGFYDDGREERLINF